MLYSQSDVYAAALAAYQASACSVPDYHENKAYLFVERVVRAQNLEHRGEADSRRHLRRRSHPDGRVPP